MSKFQHENLNGPENGKIVNSQFSLETQKNESEVEAVCYKFKKNTKEVILEWFLTTCMGATTPRNSIFTFSLLKSRAFFKWSPMFGSLFVKDEKRYR